MKGKESGLVSLQDTAKETTKNRLQELIGERSIRGAAADWGLTYSTLNNYLTRGSQPRIEAARKIAGAEGVSVEWVLYGLKKNSSDVGRTDGLDGGDADWNRIYESMSEDERATFTRIVYRHGVSTILQLADDENIQLLALPNQVKKISLMLKNWPSEKLREISADLEGDKHENTPVTMQDSNQKKAV